MRGTRSKTTTAALLLLGHAPAWAAAPGAPESFTGAPGLWQLSFVALGAFVVLCVAIPSCLQLRKTIRQLEASRQEQPACSGSPD
jgi:hypothetical protein